MVVVRLKEAFLSRAGRDLELSLGAELTTLGTVPAVNVEISAKFEYEGPAPSQDSELVDIRTYPYLNTQESLDWPFSSRLHSWGTMTDGEAFALTLTLVIRYQNATADQYVTRLFAKPVRMAVPAGEAKAGVLFGSGRLVSKRDLWLPSGKMDRLLRRLHITGRLWPWKWYPWQ